MYAQQSGETARFPRHGKTVPEGLVVWDQKGVVIVWPDGHRSRLPWATLRAACPCWECGARGADAADAGDLPAPDKD